MRQLSWLNEQFTALPDDIRPLVRRFPRIEQKVKEFYFGAADKAAVSEQTFPQLIRVSTSTSIFYYSLPTYLFRLRRRRTLGPSACFRHLRYSY